MKVLSLGWLGVRTSKSVAMAAFYRDVLGIDVIRESPGDSRFRIADGTEVHVYGAEDVDHAYFGSGPVVGIVVDSFEEARARMLAAGVAFLYPKPQRSNGRAWQHFRGPDGNIYEIIGPDDPP